MNKIKNKLLIDSTFTTIAGYFTKFISMFRGFIVARLLDPSLYGYFSGLSLIFLYNSQAHLGILHGLNRGLSLARGANEIESYDDIKNSGITAIIILSLLFGSILFGYSFLAVETYSIELIWGFRVYALLSILFHVEYVLHSLLRVEHKFRQIIQSKLIFSILNLVLVIIFAYYYRFYGVLIAFLISLIIQNLYLINVTKINLKFRIQISIIKKLILVGAPISFVYLVDIILNTVDRLMIAKYLASAELGYYGIGLALSSEFLLQIPNSISYVIYPRLLEKYGKYNDVACLSKLFHTASGVISCIMAVVIGILYVTVDYIIVYLLPRYTPAISVARILIFSAYFMAINQIAVRCIITIGKTKKLIIFQVLAILINIILNYFMIKNGYGIRGVAIATAFSLLVYSVCVTHYTLEMFYGRFVSSIKWQILLYIPLIYIILLLSGICQLNFIESAVTKNIMKDVYSCTFKVSFLVIASLPMLVHSIKKAKSQFES